MTINLTSLQNVAVSLVGALLAASLFISAAVGPVGHRRLDRAGALIRREDTMVIDLYRQWMLRLQAFLATPTRATNAQGARR